MFLLKEPSQDRIQRFLSTQRHNKFSYSEVGASRTGSPSGYAADHNRIKVGEGPEAFERAAEAIRKWKMFDITWLRILRLDQQLEPGANVAVLARHFGFWSLNPCRIVYLIDESAPVQRFGFAYGTLAGHAMSGEERFTVERHHGDDSVWYDIFAFSRPAHFLSSAGYPLSRLLQKRFAQDSKRAMVKAASI